MTTSNRQNSLLVSQDWTKVYQTFREADFQSYDFETIRKSMVDYLKRYYPEDFNDFIESSEYVALIDLVAFMGQSLAFRADMNTRETYMDTAERRDSILKLARLVSYNPKRCVSSSGFLKFDSISTTEVVTDSNGLNLANLSITWDDVTNDNWQEQFSVILNAALTNSQVVGKPGNSQVINGITTDEYAINILPTATPVFKFTASISGAQSQFEAVSASSVGKSYVYEVDPRPTGIFNIVYRNDGKGNSSNNTGFFLFFKQGELQGTTFGLNEALPNRVININRENTNNTDVWLYSLSPDGALDTLWTQVPAVTGVNVIYNKSEERNLYQVSTRAADQIDLVFGDGAFANIPQGNFRVYSRSANGTTYKIVPSDMTNIVFSMNYVSRTGTVEVLTITASLKYTVTNASARESADEIRQKAPQQYYTQGRMITGEDYNILPYTSFSNVVKVKAVNRTSSGVSRYLDVIDPSGKYSSTNIFAQDGALYLDDNISSMTFATTTMEIKRLVKEELADILTTERVMHFVYDKFPRKTVDVVASWVISSVDTNGCSGFLTDGSVVAVGGLSANATQYIIPGAIIKFVPDTGYHFNAQNAMVRNSVSAPGDKDFIYACVMSVSGNGYGTEGNGLLADSTGAIVLNVKVPQGAIPSEVATIYKNNLSDSIETTIIEKITAYNNFGIGFSVEDQYNDWYIISSSDINTEDEFSLTNARQSDDSSWIVRFEYSNGVYTMYWRGLEYYFQSVLETKFYFDPSVKIYDTKTGTTIKDTVKILKVNNKPDSSAQFGNDYAWQIYDSVVESDGYEDRSKVKVTFADSNNDGVPDNPDIFGIIVAPSVNENTKRVFFKKQIGYDSFVSYVPTDEVSIEYTSLAQIVANKTLYLDGQVFYAFDEDTFYVLTVDGSTRTVDVTSDYIAKVGRGSMYFQYRHNSPNYRRIDPTPNNIIDLYMLTKTYANDYKAWVRDTSGKVTQPASPLTEDLKIEFQSLEDIKAISDTLIYNPAKFKPLFGAKAEPTLQATFKVVKNTSMNISDNEIKSKVIGGVNAFFEIDNWDFGETFFFSELSAYLHSSLAPYISSIVIVPNDSSGVYGDLQQINADVNEILISCATVSDVEVISAITTVTLRST